MMNINNYFNKNIRGSRKEILGLYENILLANGIYTRLDKIGFNACYERYKKLGGRKDFVFLGEPNGLKYNWIKAMKVNG